MLKLRKALPGVRIEAVTHGCRSSVCRSSLKSACAQPTMKKARKQPINATTLDAARLFPRTFSLRKMQMSMKGREALRKSLFDAKAAAIAIDVGREGF